MPYRPVDVVEVIAWGDRVGAVALDPATGYYVFEYAPEWQAKGIELAPTTMPIGASRYVFPALSVETFYRLPAMLADALPDAFGNALDDGLPRQRRSPDLCDLSTRQARLHVVARNRGTRVSSAPWTSAA